MAESKELSKRIRGKSSIVSMAEKFSIDIFPLCDSRFSPSLLQASDFFLCPFCIVSRDISGSVLLLVYTGIKMCLHIA